MKQQQLRTTRRRRMSVEGELLTRPRREPKPKRDTLFAWTVFLLLLIGVVFACWIGSFYVFQHPENPRSYSILRKLKKIDPPKRFEPTAAPRGRFLTASQLLKLYNDKTETELARINTELLQGYIGNYSVKEKEVPYLMGQFTVLKAQPLSKADVFTSGYVVLARSVEEPKLNIEQLYPAAPEYREDLEKMLAPGVDVKLERTYDLSAVLHVEKLPEGELQVTIVPLNYDSYGIGDGREVHLSPPVNLNLEGPLPIFSAGRLEEIRDLAVSEKQDAEAQKNAAVVARSGPTPDQSVIRVARAVPLHGKAVAIPKVTPTPPAPPAVAALPRISPTPAAPIAASTPPLKVLPAIPLVSPTPTPAPVLVKATPSPTASPGPTNIIVASTPVPTVKPIIASSAAPTPKTNARWQTYKAGQMPRGRLLEVPDLGAFAKGGGPRGTTYLQGNFVVKATNGSRATLRSSSNIASALGLGGQTQVFVEFPNNSAAPKAGEQISRSGSRPFQITSIQRAPNGQIQVYAREITEP